MEIRYMINGALKKTTVTDENLDIKEEKDGGRTLITVTAKKELTLRHSYIDIPHIFSEEDLIFANGYQGWTESREFAAFEHLRDLNKVPEFIENKFHFKGYGSQSFRPLKKKLLTAFDYAYVKGSHPFFIGSRNFKNAYLMIDISRNPGWFRLESDIFGRKLAPGEEFTVYDYMVSDNVSEGLEEYFGAYKPRSERKLFGYTSWYNHYQKINTKVIELALSEADERFDLFQIDDGYETFIGDWLDVDPKKFPEGLSPIVEMIHERNMLAGIWLAPFVAEKKSKLMTEHPDWIGRDLAGDFSYSGCNWSGHCALNLNVPEAVSYVKEVLHTYADMGFDFFKLDFIYAVNLCPLEGKTRAETSEFAYSLLREELGEDKLILGCGAVLSNGYEKFDYMRIGPDVSLSFDDVFYMRLFHPERISTKKTIMNTIFRYPMDGKVFLNDPDVFLLRDKKISLSKEQRYALTTINALFGSMLMTLDDPGTYDEEQDEILEQTLTLFREAKVKSYERRGKFIFIDYELRGEVHSLIYDTEKGIFTDGTEE